MTQTYLDTTQIAKLININLIIASAKNRATYLHHEQFFSDIVYFV